MDDAIRKAINTDRVIDITTVGRKTGQLRRKEIRFTNIEGVLYITGSPPRKRSWFANLLSKPEFTFHVKESAQADLEATATPVRDSDSRREIFGRLLPAMGRPPEDIDQWLEHSPLVRVEIEGY